MSARVWWLAVIVPLFAAACSKDSNGDSTVAVATIGKAGGTLTSSDKRLTLEVPPDALTGDVEFKIARVGDEVKLLAGRIGPAYRLSPAGLTFAKGMVKLTLTLTAADLGNADRSKVYLSTAQDGEWTPLVPADDGTDKARVAGLTTHFSTFAAAQMEPPPGCPDAPAGVKACQCDRAAVKSCAATLNIGVRGCGWYYSAPKGPWLLEPLYKALDCYQNTTGHENVFDYGGRPRGGGTRCERTCCRKAGGLYRARNHKYFCPAAESCVASCARSGNDKTACELAAAQVCSGPDAGAVDAGAGDGGAGDAAAGDIPCGSETCTSGKEVCVFYDGKFVKTRACFNLPTTCSARTCDCIKPCEPDITCSKQSDTQFTCTQ